MTNPSPNLNPNFQFRQLALSKRDKLSDEKKYQYCLQICNRLIEQFDSPRLGKIKCNHQYVAIYLAIKNEVDLTLFLNWAFNQSLQLCAPMIKQKYGEMDFFAFNQNTPFSTNRLAIKEPVVESNSIVNKNQIAIAIFPLSAFDSDGHRIGMGGGYYDRYFQHSNARRIGVGYEVQKIECGKIIRQAHDLKLDELISEKKIYRFN